MMQPTQHQNLKPNYRVVIIGAGPAGSACALRLRQLGIDDILLVEASNLQNFSIGESIPPIANPVLRDLGVYDDFLLQKHLPCHGSRSCWRNERPGYNDFLLSPYGHGWHLNRTKFNTLLANTAVEKGVDLKTETAFKSCTRVGDKYELHLKNKAGESNFVYADIVVDASGKRGVFARTQGSLKQNTLPLLCLAVRFQMKNTSVKMTGLTHLEAAKNGWWYAAGLPDNRLLIAFYTDATTAKTHRLQESQNWMTHVKQTLIIAPLLDKCEVTQTKPTGFPAPSYLLHPLTGENWLAVGDAASAYDPLTAAGIMKALQNGQSAAVAIQQKLSGEAENFAGYQNTVQQQFGQYLYSRTALYQKENRWSDESFWKKLHKERVSIKI